MARSRRMHAHRRPQINQLANASPEVRQTADAAITSSLNYDLDRLRKSLSAQPIESLHADLVRDWQLPDGPARVQALAKGDANDIGVLRKFAPRRELRSAIASRPEP